MPSQRELPLGLDALIEKLDQPTRVKQLLHVAYAIMPRDGEGNVDRRNVMEDGGFVVETSRDRVCRGMRCGETTYKVSVREARAAGLLVALPTRGNKGVVLELKTAAIVEQAKVMRTGSAVDRYRALSASRVGRVSDTRPTSARRAPEPRPTEKPSGASGAFGPASLLKAEAGLTNINLSQSVSSRGSAEPPSEDPCAMRPPRRPGRAALSFDTSKDLLKPHRWDDLIDLAIGDEVLWPDEVVEFEAFLAWVAKQRREKFRSPSAFVAACLLGKTDWRNDRSMRDYALARELVAQRDQLVTEPEFAGNAS